MSYFSKVTVEPGNDPIVVEGTVLVDDATPIDINLASVAGSVPISDGGNVITVDGTVGVSEPTGYTPVKLLDLDESEDEVKASAGRLHGYHLHNTSAAVVFVKFYNATTASVTVGTTTPVMVIGLPAGAAANVEWQRGVVFGTAITVACTTGVLDSDTTGPATNAVTGTFFYV